MFFNFLKKSLYSKQVKAAFVAAGLIGRFGRVENLVGKRITILMDHLNDFEEYSVEKISDGKIYATAKGELALNEVKHIIESFTFTTYIHNLSVGSSIKDGRQDNFDSNKDKVDKLKITIYIDKELLDINNALVDVLWLSLESDGLYLHYQKICEFPEDDSVDDESLQESIITDDLPNKLKNIGISETLKIERYHIT